MNFNTEHENEEKQLKLIKKPTFSKQTKKENQKQVVTNKFDINIIFIAIVFFMLLATIILFSGATLWKYKESFTAFGESSFKPIYNNTYKTYTKNIYNNGDWFLPCIICVSILVVVCIFMLIRKNKYPNVFDYIFFGISILPSIIYIFCAVLFIPRTEHEVVGTPGVLTGHANYKSTVSFAFVVVAICFILFAIGVFAMIRRKKNNIFYVNK